ncbi:alanine--tRNA ligase [bacterium]|nr:alanine--tRNA ligase [bacterium]
MKANDVRTSFLTFFEERDHKIVRSAPVFPKDDPTLLFTNAGMNQFKDVFLGTGSRPWSRAVDSQKCIRVSGKHNDLEEVGFDTYHHTFFEMLGNWSFGDYYKKEAIRWAWELITDVWKLPKKHLYATVFREDDEAEELWKKVTDITSSHVMRFDEKDNFWEMGDTGPCGPCSEIHIDLGEGACDRQHVRGHVCGVNGGCSRFIELWNLVFIQYNRDAGGTCTPLPSKHVDTGMGFERAVAVLQGKDSNYQTDVFMPLLEAIADLTGTSFRDRQLLPAFRVIADHVRTLAFAITDGALPSNEGRGYVLRRILRRGARYGRNLGMRDPFMYKLVDVLGGMFADAYPEIGERTEHTVHVIRAEEERFNDVLDRGIEIFETAAANAVKRGEGVISGHDAFQLYDTYGFPLDLTQLMAREKGLEVDEQGFSAALELQRETARKRGKFTNAEEIEWQEIHAAGPAVFLGYDRLVTRARISKYRLTGAGVEIVLDETPFYAESGGQIGDTGFISGDGFKLHVTDTVKNGDHIVHIGAFVEGDTITCTDVEAVVDASRRLSIARNHTATHLLHRVLKNTLGDHVNQAGSLVAPDRLRFDFTHFEAIESGLLDTIEAQINDLIRKNTPLTIEHSSLDDARARGATALFGEKYDDEVRVVSIADFSMELCGGTHVDRTGEIGSFRILREEGIAAGVRRIEAVTGEGAERLSREEKHLIQEIEAVLNCRREEIAGRVADLIRDKKETERALQKLQTLSAADEAAALLDTADSIDGVTLVRAVVSVDSIDGFRALGDKLREKLVSGVGVLGTRLEDKVNFLCVVTDDLIKRNVKAGDIVRAVAARAGGSGGGRPHFALAGGKDADKLEEAVAGALDILQETLRDQR